MHDVSKLEDIEEEQDIYRRLKATTRKYYYLSL